jgi:hypothetical protein
MKRKLLAFRTSIARGMGFGLLALAAVLSSGRINGQSITGTNYPVTLGTGTLATVPGSGLTIHSASGNDDTPGPLGSFGSGFVFWYGGAPYTSVSVGPDGFLRLGTAAAAQFTNDLVSTTNTPIIAPYWDDVATGTNGSVVGFLTGTAPNRIYVINWLVTIPRATGGTAASTFQCWLYENGGQIEFVYGNGVVTNGSYSIGHATTSGAPTRIASGTINATFSASTFAYLAAAPNNINSQGIPNGSKITFTPPPGPTVPTSLTFTSVTPAGMTLNWIDNATTETGYAIFRSDDDGASYSLLTTIAANSTSYVATGLVPNKNFFWKVMAYSDLPPAGSLDGSQATSPPGIVVSTGTGGNWSNVATWVGGAVPIATDSVVIDDGDTVIVDVTSAVCWSVRVGTGTSGILSYISTPASTLSVGNNVFVSSGAIFDAGSGSLTSHALRIGGTSATALGEGSLVVNGTFDMQTTAGVPVTFFGINNASVSGTPTVLDFRSVTLNKGASSTAPPTLELLTGYTVQGANTVGLISTHTAGTLKISGSFTQNAPLYSTAAYTIPALGGVWLNNANFSVDGQAGSPTNNGLLRITTGTYNIGTASGNSLGFGTGARFTVEGGTINATGRINTANAITFTCSGGTVNVATIGNASSGTPSFGITAAGSTATISGGTLNLVQRNTGATILDYNVAAGSGSVTGGVLNVGTAATATNFNFRIQGVTPSVVIDNTTNNKTLTLSGNTTILGTLTVPVNDTLNLNNFTMQVLGSVTNNGHINGKGSGVIQFTGTAAQSYGGSGGVDSLFRIIDDNENGGVTFNKAVYAQSVYFYDTAMIYNSSNITLGYNNLPVTLQYGIAAGAKVVGQFDMLPTMNLGTGTYSVTYAQESAARTTGIEIPVSRTMRNLVINNTNGVVLSGGALSLEVGGVLTLTSGKLTTTAVNIINVTDSITGSVSGGSATAYVNGPMTRQLPAALYNQRTYNFPVGKATYKLFELINPGTNSGGTVTVGVEAFDANSGGTAGLNMTSVDTTQYWRVQLVAGSSNMDSANMRVTSSGLNGLSRLSYASTVNGAYDKISGIPSSATQIRTAATRLTGAAIEGFYGLGTEVVGLSGTYLVGASQTAPNYTNLTSVVADLNSKQVQGNVVFELQADYNATTETFPLTFTEPAKTDAAWTLTIQPAAGTTDSIYGSFNGPLLNLSAIRNVILEGRQGGSGTPKSLIVRNDNTGASATAVTLINDARNNMLRYAVFKGASTTATAGVITFSTGITTGNDSNTIDNCDIADAVSTPASLISSLGSTDVIAKYNDYITVTNNNLYNFFNSTAEANGFKISNGNNNWTITGNSIYQTASRNTSALHYTFNLQNSDNRNALNNMVITNNYIGGSAPLCGGTAWTMTSAAGRICSFFNMGNLAMSRVSNNTFANFNCNTTSTATGAPGTWNAIQYVNGMLNIDSNTIGNADSSSIVLTTGSAGVALPIAVTATSTAGTYSITGNTIGSIKMNGGGTVSNNLTCINITTSVNTITYNVDNNTIGNSFPDNLIAAVSNSATAQSIIGINNTSVVNLRIRNNTIHNMFNAYDGTGAGRVVGIASSSGKDTILNNTITMLKSAAPQTGSGANSSLVGIAFTSATGGSLVTRNTIYDLSNTHLSAAVKVTGIHYSGGTADIVGRNAVHSFSTISTSKTAQQTGINYAGGTSTIQNNMVRLGIDAAGANQTTTPVIIGMAKTGGNLNAYFNTVYVGGIGVVDSVVNTYAFNKSASNSDTVYNNIFVNQRSNAGAVGGGHYAVSLNNTTGWIANNNVYYVNGTGDTLAVSNGITYQGIGDWKLATAKDAASIFGDPSFVNATGNAGAVSVHLTGATPAEGTGLTIASVNEDFDGDDRSAFTPTDIGADGGNFTPVDLSPPSISFSAITNDTIKVTRPLTDYFTIADPSGVKLTGANAPRFYFKKKTDNDAFVGNTSADNGWKYVSIGNLTNPYTFTIDYTIINGGSVSIGDTVQYFIVAQDSAGSPNVGAIPSTGFVASSVSTVVAAPSSPGFFAITPFPLAGPYNVGTSVPADYPTITAAIAAANTLGVKAPVIFNLIDPVYNVASGEQFPITMGVVNGSSSTNTITISPAPAVAAVVGAQSGAVAVFKFLNAKNIVLDGLNSGGSSLTLYDSTTASATALIWLASTPTVGPGCKNISVKNMTMNGGSNATIGSFGVVLSVDGASPSTTGGMNNDTIIIQGNTILKTYQGICATGTAAVSAGGLDFLTISDNIIGPATSGTDNTGLAGIQITNALNVNITGDSIRNLNASTRTAAGAMLLNTVNGAVVSKNIIRDITGSASVSGVGSLVGMLLSTNVTNATVDKNTIKAISNTSTGGWGGRGMIISTGLAASNIVVSNNVITDIFTYSDVSNIYWPVGLHIDGSSGGLKLYNNSINLFGVHPGLTGACGAASLLVNSASSGLDIRNNVLVNSYENSSSTTESSFAFNSTAANSVYSNIDFNDYYVSGTSGVLGFLGTAQTTLALLKTATGQDVSSINVNPQFVTSYDLRPGLGTVTALGTTIAGITTDILDSARNSPPSMGAYENGVDVSGPVIVYTPITNINSTANYVLTGFATMTDATGVNVTPGVAPRIYYKKRSDNNAFGTYPADNIASFNGWKYVEASNATSPFDFTIDNSLLTGGAVVQGVDTIQYFVVAQDISVPVNFVSANPATGFVGTAVDAVTGAPTTPNQYVIVNAPLAGPYNIGAAELAPNYTTITSAITDMNLRGISAAVTFNLMDASYTTPSETFPVVLTSVVGASATNTVTIKPSTGVVTTVTGSSATSIFKINGADYIIFDGSNNGSASRDMTVENTNASTTTAVMWVASANATNGASNNMLKNMNIVGNAGTTTAAGIVTGSGITIGTAGDSANSNNTVQGCSFIKAQNGIFILGNATLVDMNWNILNNIVGSTNAPDKLGLRGVALQNAQNFVISGNTIQGAVTATTTTSSGILVGGLATNGMISRNMISDVKNTNVGEWGTNGLQLSSTNVAANITVQNNFISDIAAVGYAPSANVGDNGYGIIITSGGGYNLYYNTVHMNTNQPTDGLPAALNVAAAVVTPASLDIRNNIFMNSQTQTGEKYSVYFGTANTVITAMNYNNYFANAGANLAFLGANLANLAALQATFGGNTNSISDSTSFVSATDLHITGATVFNHAYIGTPIAGITTDIDGQTREPLFPYMGADEDIAFPLPVTLTSFTATAKTNDVLVSWTTASETNNKGFEVQRSIDGRNFEYVTFVKGAGNSSRVINYNSTDAKAFEKANSTVLYYRLKQVDFNGEFSFSNTVKVTKNVAAANALTVYPNPFNAAYSVSFEAVNAGTVSLVMVDLQGKTVASHTSPVVKGSNTISFDNLNDLQTGVYFVKVTVDGETQVLKLVKN